MSFRNMKWVIPVLILGMVVMAVGCSDDDGGTTPAAVTFQSAVQTGGASGTADSTGLTLTFSIDPTSLVASNITVTGATKGALSGSGTTRSLAISGITVGNGETVSVAIANPSGFTISGSPQTAVVYKDTRIAVTFESAVQTGGTSGTADSTGLTLTFSVDPTTLAASDITVTGATKGALSGSGTTRSLAISDITVGDGETVSVAIASPSGFTISGSPQTAMVYRKAYTLRETGPAGGLIFYDKGSYSDGWRYLEAAPQSTEWTSKQWGKYGTSVSGTGTEIGTGKDNTILIVAKLNEAPADSDRAAQLTDALSYGGSDDWFLPSKDELYEMCWVLHSRKWNGSTSENNPAYGTSRVGGFANENYWSSSEHDIEKAWYLPFGDGGQNANYKDGIRWVRAVRDF